MFYLSGMRLFLSITILLAFLSTAFSQLILEGDTSAFTISYNGQLIAEKGAKHALVSAHQIENKISFNLGSFKFKGKTLAKCKVERIQAIQREQQLVSILGRLTGKDCNCSYVLNFKESAEGQLDWDLRLTDPKMNRLTLHFASKEEEQFFGFGEQFTFVNMKGKEVPIFTEEQGVGRGDAPVSFFTNFANADGDKFTSYAPIPFTLTSDNKAYFVENTEHIVFDLKDKEKASIEVWSSNASGKFWLSDDPKEILEKYTYHTGRMPQLPDWAYGTWLGLQGGDKKVTEIVDGALAAGNPVSAVWIQDWVGKRPTRIGSRLWWDWRPDPKSYPDLKGFIKKMNAKDIKVLGYINSFLAEEAELAKEAITKNYLVMHQDGSPYLMKVGGFNAYLVDLSNPAARKWMKSIIKRRMIGAGFSGWMADFAEWLPHDAKIHSGEDPLTWHNRYPVEWAKLNREAIREAGKEGKIIFFNRSGFSYSNQHSTLFWAGDQIPSWQKNDGMPSALAAMVSSGMSGITLNHTDIGGYTSVKKFPVYYLRTRDLFYRWTEWAVFTPVFRTHEGLTPEANIQPYSDSASQAFFARMANLHLALKPYFKILGKEASTTGAPLLRHPFLEFPKDENTYDLRYQFLLGEDLMVIPVIKRKSKKAKGYLPAGKWENVWTGEVYSGEKNYTFVSPYGQPAVFLRKGGTYYDMLRTIFLNFVTENTP